MKKRDCKTKKIESQLEHLAEKGNPISQFEYGIHLINNENCIIDGIRFIFKSEENGNSKAHSYLIENIQKLYENYFSKYFDSLEVYIKFSIGKLLLNTSYHYLGIDILKKTNNAGYSQSKLFLDLQDNRLNIDMMLSSFDKVISCDKDKIIENRSFSELNTLENIDNIYNILLEKVQNGCLISQFLLAVVIIATNKYDIDIGISNLISSAENGYCKSQYYLSLLYIEGKLNFTKNLKEGFTWCSLAAQQGFGLAEYKLSFLYNLGLGVKKNEGEAFKYMIRALDSKVDKANLQLGIYYKNGIGVQADQQIAYKFFKKAAKNHNDIDAYYILGITLLQGEGTEKNTKKGIKCLTLASKNGSTAAKYILGDCYYYGEGCEQNYNDAFEYYKEAAKEGYCKAIYKLALCYIKGEGVESNLSLGIKMIREIEDDLSEEDKINIINEYQHILKAS